MIDLCSRVCFQKKRYDVNPRFTKLVSVKFLRGEITTKGSIRGIPGHPSASDTSQGMATKPQGFFGEDTPQDPVVD